MNILCLGCSWTYGYGLKSNQTYPYYIEYFSGDNVDNAGFPGLSIYEYFDIINTLNDYDYYVIQLTTFDRCKFGFNGLNKEFFGKDTNKVLRDNFWNDEQPRRLLYDNEQFITLTNGIGLDIKNNTYESLDNLYETTKKFNNHIKKEHIKNFIELWYDNIMLSTESEKNYLKEILLIQNTLKMMNKNFLMFYWTNHDFMKNHENIMQFIDKNYFINKNKGYKDFFNVLDEYKNKYILDNGFHLNEMGNKFLAKYIFEKIYNLD